MTKKGFTLIEMLIVLAILAILASFITGNLLNSLKKGRDVRRKTDLAQIQKALEMYYEDKKTYPLTAELILSTATELTDPSSGKIYMQELPQDPKTACEYYYVGGTSTYKLYAYLENTEDTGPGVKQAGYGINCVSTSCPCKFGLSSYNTTP